ncbi:hypothetical protein INT47_006145 [Mucor saturninus]|uniref:Galactose oxidase n=1 Tax=Mucor saturninus TaxID=64648 RepID=A0A8H7RBH7_9FUNG|nr:hypothetical protein INT47_006145 [Mucor saturninus]
MFKNIQIEMRNIILATFLTLAGVNHIVGQEIPRYDAACGLLSAKIYCLGGMTERDGGSDNSIGILDLAAYSGSTADELKDKWHHISSIVYSPNTQMSDYSQRMVLPDEKSMLLSGGESLVDNPLAPMTRVYHSESNSWNTFPEYKELDFGRRRIYHASSVFVPNYGIGFYGGLEIFVNSSWTYNGQNMSAYEEHTAKGTVRHIGYTSLTFFNSKKPADPWFIYQPQNNLPSAFTSFQTSIYDIKNSRILFFGGRSLGKSVNDSVEIPFDNIIVFDMLASNWTTQLSTGSQIPTPRTEHTTTLVGPMERDVLLFGGEDSKNHSEPCSDYAFTLNLDTYIWQLQDIKSKPNTSMARVGHSVSYYEITNTILILNTTTPSNITLVDKYIDINNASVFLTEPHRKVNTETVIGIIIGSVIGVLILVGVIVLSFIKKKRAKEERKRQELEEYERQRQIVEPIMEVNWDEIEKKYVEQSNSLSQKRSLTPGMTDDTIINPMPIRFQRPNAMDKNGIYGTKNYRVQKPDGGARYSL